MIFQANRHGSLDDAVHTRSFSLPQAQSTPIQRLVQPKREPMGPFTAPNRQRQVSHSGPPNRQPPTPRRRRRRATTSFDIVLRLIYFCTIIAITIGITKMAYQSYYADKPLRLTYVPNTPVLGIVHKVGDRKDYPLDYPKYSLGSVKQEPMCDGMCQEVDGKKDYPVGFPKSSPSARKDYPVGAPANTKLATLHKPSPGTSQRKDYPVDFPANTEVAKKSGWFTKTFNKLFRLHFECQNCSFVFNFLNKFVKN